MFPHPQRLPFHNSSQVSYSSGTLCVSKWKASTSPVLKEGNIKERGAISHTQDCHSVKTERFQLVRSQETDIQVYFNPDIQLLKLLNPDI